MSQWYQNAIFYHLYPLGLCRAEHMNNGCTSNRLQYVEQWIPHIKSMFCNAVLFGPVFQSLTHGYDTTDFKCIDGRLGTNEDFAELTGLLHQNGLKVVVDGVFNHTGRDFFAFADVVKRKSQSVYKDWFSGVDFNSDNAYHDGFSYDAWNGHYELVKLNLRNIEVRDYLLQVVKHWIDCFDIDGIRLDCADCLDFGFMEELRTFCIGFKPDFWLMGEVIHGDYSKWVNDRVLHSVTNYECYKGLYSSHNDVNLFELAYALNRQNNVSTGLYKDVQLYNFADNHDVSRLAESLSKPEYLYTSYILLMTMPGIPSIYYGSEWGIGGKKGGNDDWNLRPHLELSDMCSSNGDLLRTIQKLGRIRAENRALSQGDYCQLYLEHELLVFQRTFGSEQLIIAINTSSRSAQIQIKSNPLTYSDLLNNNEKYHATGNMLSLTVFPHWGMILKPDSM